MFSVAFIINFKTVCFQITIFSKVRDTDCAKWPHCLLNLISCYIFNKDNNKNKKLCFFSPSLVSPGILGIFKDKV